VRISEAEQRVGEDDERGGSVTAGGGTKRDKRDLSQWRRMADAAVPPARIRVWHALERGMQKYQKVLFKRATLIKDCDGLAASNAEIRQLLAFYLAQPQADLQVGPEKTMQVGPNTRDVTELARAATLKAASARSGR
jgi:hypothetical protein